MKKSRDYIVSEVIEGLIRHTNQSADVTGSYRPIGAVAAVSREEATRLAAQSFPGRKITVTRVGLNNQAVQALFRELTSSVSINS
jgi:hypothetical protein